MVVTRASENRSGEEVGGPKGLVRGTCPCCEKAGESAWISTGRAFLAEEAKGPEAAGRQSLGCDASVARRVRGGDRG